MNWLKYLVGLAALAIAGCAAYFSVTGLGVLFSGATYAVMEWQQHWSLQS